MTHIYTMPRIALIDNWSVDTQLDCAFSTKRFKIYVKMNMIGVP